MWQFFKMISTTLGGAGLSPTDPEQQLLEPWQLDKETILQQIYGILPGSPPSDLTAQAEVERHQASFSYEECFELAKESYSLSPDTQKTLSPQAVDAIACIAAKWGNKALIPMR